jgi:hypothetical protein
MLVDDIGDVTITNDGATILKQLEIQHPAAKVPRLRSRSRQLGAVIARVQAFLILYSPFAADPRGASGVARRGGGRWHHFGGHLGR